MEKILFDRNVATQLLDHDTMYVGISFISITVILTGPTKINEIKRNLIFIISFVCHVAGSDIPMQNTLIGYFFKCTNQSTYCYVQVVNTNSFQACGFVLLYFLDGQSYVRTIHYTYFSIMI